jgi:hypothetical protein
VDVSAQSHLCISLTAAPSQDQALLLPSPPCIPPPSLYPLPPPCIPLPSPPPLPPPLPPPTCSMLRMGESSRGPLLSSISKSTPSAGSGVRMSENRMTPSGRKEHQGCRLISVMRSGVSLRARKEGCFWARAR